MNNNDFIFTFPYLRRIQSGLYALHGIDVSDF